MKLALYFLGLGLVALLWPLTGVASNDTNGVVGSAIGNPTPATPTAADDFSIPYSISRGGSPTAIQVQRAVVHDNTIDLLVNLLTGDFSVGSGVVGRIDVGAVHAGTYNVRLLVAQNTDNSGPYTVVNSRTLVILGGPNASFSIPTLSPSATSLLASLLIAMGLIALTRWRLRNHD